MANRVGVRKVVLVTGSSAGIGAALAREAARRGHDLALTARRSNRLEALAEEITRENPGAVARAFPADLDDPATPARLVAETLDVFGRLDVLVNNAGFGLPTLFADGDPEDLRRQLSVNLVAPILLTRAAIPALLESRGTVINIGSAISGLPNPALGVYGATKAGLAYWNDALRREVGHLGVRVCLVEPGPVRTEFFSALVRLGPGEGGYHAMLDAPADWMAADVAEVARRIVRLIDRPKRRLSVLKRIVWPWRATGTLFRIFPGLGDLGVATVLRHYEARVPRRKSSASEALDHATRGD
jgi:short-subunit dehydrogenase